VSELARVDSVDALKKFRAKLCKFAEIVGIALDEADTDVQRTEQWITHEQSAHWKRQLERRSELVTRAKSALNRKKLQKTALGTRPSCVEEEKALAAAQRQLDEARDKAANVRRWSRMFHEETFAHQAMVQGLSVAVSTEVPGALAQLDNMIEAIEAYATSTAPTQQRSVAPEAGEEFPVGSPGVPSVARDAPPAPDQAVQRYAGLRRRTPAQQVRDQAALVDDSGLDALRFQLDQATREVLRTLAVERVPVDPDDSIVVARGLSPEARVYLERRESAQAGASGWYLGFADENTAQECQAARVADLLATSPDLESVLELPAGSLVVLDGPVFVAALDGQDRPLVPRSAPERKE
jgi:hypothetical protein